MAYWPGMGNSDLHDQISQYLQHDYNDHYPVIQTIMLGWSASLFGTFAGYTFLRLIAFALALAYMLHILKKHGVKLPLLIGTFVVTVFAPVTFRMVSDLKYDVEFTIALVVLTAVIFDMLSTKFPTTDTKSDKNERLINYRREKVQRIIWDILLVIGLFGVFEYRKNSIFVLIAGITILSVRFRHNFKETLLIPFIVFAVLAAIIFVPQSMKKSRLNTAGEIEAMSIPFQQIAQTYNDENANFPDDQRLYFQRINSDKTWRGFVLGNSDPVKGYFRSFSKYNTNTGAFLTNWLTLGLKNPVDYFYAYYMQTKGYYIPNFKGTERLSTGFKSVKVGGMIGGGNSYHGCPQFDKDTEDYNKWQKECYNTLITRYKAPINWKHFEELSSQADATEMFPAAKAIAKVYNIQPDAKEGNSNGFLAFIVWVGQDTSLPIYFIIALLIFAGVRKKWDLFQLTLLPFGVWFSLILSAPVTTLRYIYPASTVITFLLVIAISKTVEDRKASKAAVATSQETTTG
jgi:hypothetical protein